VPSVLRSGSELSTFQFGTYLGGLVDRCCPVVELRQYTLHPGQRDVLIALFDRFLVEPQDAEGMRVIGQFRDLDQSDRFVWLRGFPDMERRRASLEAFYGGAVWRAHAAAANATMIDSDDVLLLRPVVADSTFMALPRRPGMADQPPATTVVVTICSLDRPADPSELARRLVPALAGASSPALATFVEEPSENTFPALPVRSSEHVVVWLQRIGDDLDIDAVLEESAQVAEGLLPRLAGSPTQLRLEPTTRSALR
jgi:NIPSNAP